MSDPPPSNEPNIPFSDAIIDSSKTIIKSGENLEGTAKNMIDSGNSVLQSSKDIIQYGESMLKLGKNMVDMGIAIISQCETLGDSKKLEECRKEGKIMIQSGKTVMRSGDDIVKTGMRVANMARNLGKSVSDIATSAITFVELGNSILETLET